MREKLIDIVEAYADFLDWDTKEEMVDSIMEFLATDNNVGHKWISVKDRLPEEEEKVLIYTKTGIVNYGTYTRRYGFDRKEGFICSDGFMWLSTASHWCCLPQPPKGE